MSRIKIVIPCFALFLILGCGSDTVDPGAEPDPDPDPNPEGVRLEGEDGDGAVGALVHLPPSPAPEAEIDEGFFTTRLTAMLHPDATVGEINAALDAVGAKIVSMHPDDIFLTLKIPAVVDEDEARLVAADLTAGGAFAFVLPAHRPDVSPPDTGELKDMPPQGAEPISQLQFMKFTAAWNAKSLALANDVKTIVMVPDSYCADVPHAEIGCQQFREGSATSTQAIHRGYYIGNHGYGVCSVIGADFDAEGPTGTSPAPRDLLEIRSVHVVSLTWTEILREIYERLPWGTPFVLNTSLGYNQPNTAAQKLKLALDSIYWRSLIAGGSGNFLHAASAGNAGATPGDDGESRFNSPFTAAHMFDDLRDIVDGAGVSEIDSLMLDLAWRYHADETPSFTSPLSDVLVVGSSTLWGQESAFSNRGSEVRAIGEHFLVTCYRTDPCNGTALDCCDGALSITRGTSFSSPVIAGLAAYMWTLDIDLPPDQMRSKIVHAYDNSLTPGMVDAYVAVLSLDRYADPPVRKAIFDVAGSSASPGSNGIFDENDLRVFVQAFQAANGADYDYSRYDLNGDGLTGGEDTSRFDLSMDAPPAWTDLVYIDYGDGTSDTMDERALTDCEILTYYAYLQGFYEGDTTARDEIMLHCRPLPLDAVDTMSIGVTLAATVRWVPSGATEYNEFHNETVIAEGTVVAGQIEFFIDDVLDVGGYELTISGGVTGAIIDNGRKVAWLDVDYSEAYTGGQTRYISYRLENVDIDSYTGSYVRYAAAGTGACGHITDVDIHGVASGGTWSVSGFNCTAASGVGFTFNDTAP